MNDYLFVTTKVETGIEQFFINVNSLTCKRETCATFFKAGAHLIPALKVIGYLY